VLLKGAGELGFHRRDLGVQLADNVHKRAHNDAVGAGDRLPRLELASWAKRRT
jgi:hypothetical protein